MSILCEAAAHFWAALQALGAQWAEPHCLGICKPVQA